MSITDIVKRAAFAFFVTLVSSGEAIKAQPLDGVTVIDLVDPTALAAITGYERGAGRYLITYIAANGSYAMVGDDHERLCVAWAQQGTYTGSSVVFGLSPTEQSIRLITPNVCQPFTLRFEGPTAVRVEAENKFDPLDGPLSPRAQTVRYSSRRKLIAKVPLKDIDWGLPFYSKYSVKGVRLGPLPAMKAALDGQEEIKLSALQRGHGEVWKSITVTRAPGDRRNSVTVRGYVAAAATMGWPWDVLYDSLYSEFLPPRTTVAAFDQAIVERYGQPTLKKTTQSSSRRIDYWLFDLAGRKLGPDDAAPGNCLTALSVWERTFPLVIAQSDIGPWGCPLVLRLIDDGGYGRTVSKYEIESISGYTAALKHFLARLDELRETQRKIEAVQSGDVKL